MKFIFGGINCFPPKDSDLLMKDILNGIFFGVKRKKQTILTYIVNSFGFEPITKIYTFLNCLLSRMLGWFGALLNDEGSSI